MGSAMAPVTFNNGAGVSPACKDIACAPVECFPPFKWTNAKDSGTCCPTCYTDTVTLPSDAAVMPKGEAVHASAPLKCTEPNYVYCPPLSCGEADRVHNEGDCCSHCTSIEKKSAKSAKHMGGW